MTFHTTALVDGGVLVEGTDSKGVNGTTVLHSELWNLAKAKLAQIAAQEEFDDTTRAFFKPLTDAVEKFEARIDDDEDNVVVIRKGTDHVAGEEEEKIRLDPDGTVLKLLQEGKDDQLRWVGDRLVALKA